MNKTLENEPLITMDEPMVLEPNDVAITEEQEQMNDADVDETTDDFIPSSNMTINEVLTASINRRIETIIPYLAPLNTQRANELLQKLRNYSASIDFLDSMDIESLEKLTEIDLEVRNLAKQENILDLINESNMELEQKCLLSNCLIISNNAKDALFEIYTAEIPCISSEGPNDVLNEKDKNNSCAFWKYSEEKQTKIIDYLNETIVALSAIAFSFGNNVPNNTLPTIETCQKLLPALYKRNSIIMSTELL